MNLASSSGLMLGPLVRADHLSLLMRADKHCCLVPRRGSGRSFWQAISEPCESVWLWMTFVFIRRGSVMTFLKLFCVQHNLCVFVCFFFHWTVRFQKSNGRFQRRFWQKCNFVDFAIICLYYCCTILKKYQTTITWTDIPIWFGILERMIIFTSLFLFHWENIFTLCDFSRNLYQTKMFSLSWGRQHLEIKQAVAWDSERQLHCILPSLFLLRLAF